MKRWTVVLVPAIALLGSSPAFAGDPYSTSEPPEVTVAEPEPEVTVSEPEAQPAEVTSEVKGAVVEDAGGTPDALPFTGSDIVSIIVFGLTAIAVGAAIVARSRRLARPAR